MDIGLYTGAMTLTGHLSGQSSSQEPQGLAPIPGILDAPNVVVLGASIMDAAFGNNNTLRSSIAAYAAAAGFTGTLHTRSVSGHTITSTIAVHNAASTEPALSATAGQNVYLVHSGGNNVSGARPWPGGQGVFEADYQTLLDQITTSGDTVIPMPLTKRLYTTAPQVIDGDLASEANGSKPYNENIIYPAIASHAPNWRPAGAIPYVNPYELADRFPQVLASDGIHGYGASLGRYILARVAARARGHAKDQSRSGTAILISPQKGDPNEMVVGPINHFKSLGGGAFQNQPLLCGAVTTLGTFDPFFTLLTDDTFTNASTNAGIATYARIPDPRFHDPQIVNEGIYIQGATIYDLQFEDLTPGDTLTLSAVGVRNAGGNNRRGIVTLSTGQALELDASNVATANQVTFDPVTVPASGRISLSLSVAPGSTYAYLHGVLLEFS